MYWAIIYPLTWWLELGGLLSVSGAPLPREPWEKLWKDVVGCSNVILLAPKYLKEQLKGRNIFSWSQSIQVHCCSNPYI